LPRAEMSDDREQLYRAGLTAALDAGYAVLEGGHELDAVTRAVMALEDDPLFNAGRGRCSPSTEQRARRSIMDGATLRAAPWPA